MADVIEKQISTFIEKQFPSLYREEGPVFVAFVKEYYRWLESKTNASTGKRPGEWISVTSANTVILGTNTFFSTDLSNGSSFAIYRDDNYYDIFTINAIANNTYLTVSETPSFSNNKTLWSYVTSERNVLYDTRRVLNYLDIDQTLDEFIVHFKEKYLTGIQFDTNSNIRLLVKHALDLYRAKGTPQSLELLFRVVFGTDVQLYYPGDDLFKLSDGEWFIPKYLEISLSEISPKLVNRQIIGVNSGAIAFVDRAVRREVNNRLTDVLYVSAGAGKFQTNELIDLFGEDKLNPTDRPTMIGSLTSIEIDENGVGENFKVGDIVDVYSSLGSGAIARVANTANNSGIIDINLVDGGYGYELGTNTEILISDKVLIVSNVVIDQVLNPWVNNYVQVFETITQPTASITFVGANGTFNDGDALTTYDSNNAITGTGTALTVSYSNTSAGSIKASIISGNLNARIYNEGNAVAANVSGYLNTIASGNAIGRSANVIIKISNVADVLNVNDFVYQFDTTNTVTVAAQVISVTSSGSNSTLVVNDANGIFIPGNIITDQDGNLYGNVVSIGFSIGVKLLNGNDFVSSPGNYFKTLTGNTYGTVTSVSEGTGANLSIFSLLDTEVASINTDFVNGYLSTYVNGVSYAFPASPTGNIASTIASCLTNTNITVGRIAQLQGIAKGSGYTAAPIIKIYDKNVREYDRWQYQLDITGSSGLFGAGEVVTQASSNARGLVLSGSNSSTLFLERLRLSNNLDFVITTDANSQIVSSGTGFVANVSGVNVYQYNNPIGFDAVIADKLAVSNGSLTELDLIESGYGFVNGEQVTISKGDNKVVAFAVCETLGTGKGYYRKKGGFLSDQKKLYDGHYWQQYSYDVLSSVTLNKYQEMLKQIVHVAGMINFASLLTVSNTGNQLNVQKALVGIQ